MDKFLEFEKDIVLVIVCDNRDAENAVLARVFASVVGFRIDELTSIKGLPVLTLITSRYGYIWLGELLKKDTRYQFIEVYQKNKKIFVSCE